MVPRSLACLVDLRLPLSSRCPQAAAEWYLTRHVDCARVLHLFTVGLLVWVSMGSWPKLLVRGPLLRPLHALQFPVVLVAHRHIKLN